VVNRVGGGTFITRKLYPLRAHENLKFNVYLFELLIMPHIRLISVLYKQGTMAMKRDTEVFIRRKFRDFCLLSRRQF
jgi:hypothetical protein